MLKKILILFLTISLLAAVPPALAEDRAIIVVSYAGEVKVFPPEAAESQTCQPGMVLKEGTRLVTGDGSYVMIAFDSPRRNLVKVKANSEVIVRISGDDRVEVIDGKVYTLIRELEKGSIFRIRTPDAVCGARGTGWGTEVLDGRTTGIAVFDDKVFVSGINKDGSVMEGRVWVEKGYQVKVTRFEKPGKPTALSADQVKKMRDEFSQDAGDETAQEKIEELEATGRIREERMESVTDRRDEQKIDRQEKRQDERPTGGARMKTINR